MTAITLPKHRWTSDKREARLFRKPQMRAWIEALRASDGSKYYSHTKPGLSQQPNWKHVYVVVDSLIYRKSGWIFGGDKEYLVADTLDGIKTSSVQDVIEEGYDWKG